MSVGLTPKQAKLLIYLRAYTAVRRCAPSYVEMMKALHLSSISGIHRLVHGLIERGRIIGEFSRSGNLYARSIEVVEPVIINGNRYRFIPKTRAG